MLFFKPSTKKERLPPVATTIPSLFCFLKAFIYPSISNNAPSCTPLIIDVLVDVPMVSLKPASNCRCGNLSVKTLKALYLISMPGEIAPPIKSVLETKLYFMQVPASIINKGLFGYKAIAPATAAMRSFPNVSGVL